MENLQLIRSKFPKELHKKIRLYLPYGKATIRKIFQFLEHHCLNEENYKDVENYVNLLQNKINHKKPFIKFLQSTKSILSLTEYKLLKSMATNLTYNIRHVGHYEVTLHFMDDSYFRIVTGGLLNRSTRHISCDLTKSIKKKITGQKIRLCMENFLKYWPKVGYD